MLSSCREAARSAGNSRALAASPGQGLSQAALGNGDQRHSLATGLRVQLLATAEAVTRNKPQHAP